MDEVHFTVESWSKEDVWYSEEKDSLVLRTKTWHRCKCGEVERLFDTLTWPHWVFPENPGMYTVEPIRGEPSDDLARCGDFD